MFYCEDCGIKNNWPMDFYLTLSGGRCEICGKISRCYEVPTSRLLNRTENNEIQKN
jgi:hypothetical protein